MTYKNKIVRLLQILLLIQLSSCHMKTSRVPLIFRSGYYGYLYNDIVIQTAPNVLTEYSSGVKFYVVSTWSMNGDTIFAVPRIEYGDGKEDFWYHPVYDTDSTVTSIKKTYILKGNMLEDITDYSPIDISLGLYQSVDSTNTNTIKYYRIK